MTQIITPRQHQLDLLNFSKTNGCQGTLTWHGMGLGKTLSALWAARDYLNELKAQGVQAPKVTILCPKSAIITWRDEIKKNVPELLPSAHVYAISSLHHFMKTAKYIDCRFLIFDESHALKAQDTSRIKAVANLFKLLGTTGNRFEKGKIMCLTGTPMPNGAHELYTTWAICTSPNIIEAANRLLDDVRYKQWAETFAGKKQSRFKKYTPGLGKVNTTRHAPQGTEESRIEQLGQLLAQFTHYRRVTDCIDIPKPNEQHIKLDLPDDKLLADADIEKPEAYMALVERLSRAKTPHMLGWAQQFTRLNPTTQLLVFTMHRAPLDELLNYFGNRVRLITGRENRRDRDAAINDFKAGQFQIFGMTYKCGSESLNLQNSYNSLYHGYPWTDSTLRQAMARTYRSGQTRETNHYFLTSGENDSRILGLVRAKQEATTAVEDELIRLEKSRIDRAILNHGARENLYANII